MAKINFYKVAELPDNPLKDSLYFIKNGEFSEAYLTTSNGVPVAIGNTEMIKKLIQEEDLTLPDLSLVFEGALI